MTHDLNTSNHSSVGPEGDEPVLVLTESVAFQEFEKFIEDDLARLVQLWIHTAAPNASRPRSGRERFGR